MNDSVPHAAAAPLRLAELVDAFRRLGLQRGDVALVHSAFRTVGPVENGARSVVEALLDVLGPSGTLVVPTFTFAHEAEADPIIDPRVDRSEMGLLTETARLRQDALRSTAFRHSFAAIGRRARVITEIDPALSPFDLRASFGVMLALGTQVVLLGVTYTSSTSHHFAEMVCDVPYRQTIPRHVKVRRPDGSLASQPMTDYQPKSSGGSYYGTRGPDFNRLGKMLEDRGRVGRTFIGNAAVRRFGMRDLVDLALAQAASDYNVFRTAEGQSGQLTPLDFGQCLMSPQFPDGAGRPNSVQWCVRDLERLHVPGG
jgi:aminoglycoside N3'-acetyltransferase